MASEHLQSEVRIVLLGKTGVGKSTAGNLILGWDRFKTDLSPSSVTTKCQKGTREFEGQTVAVIDTPGLFHTDKSQKEVMKELIESTMLVHPGPHVLLLVLKPNAFTNRDKKILENFQKVFDGAKHHTVVLFIHSDKYDKYDVGRFIEEHETVKKFIEGSCQTHHVLEKEATDETQVTELLQKIRNMVQEKERCCYSNKMFENAVTAFNEAMQQTEVKSASDPIQAAIQRITNLIHSIIDGKPVKTDELYKLVMLYLDIVKKVVFYLMPDEAKT